MTSSRNVTRNVSYASNSLTHPDDHIQSTLLVYSFILNQQLLNDAEKDMKNFADRMLSTEAEGRILHILLKPNSIIALLFIQNISKFKSKLKHAYLRRSMLSSYRQCVFIGKFFRQRAVQVCKYTPNSTFHPSSCLLAVLAMFQTKVVRLETSKKFRHYSLRKQLKHVPCRLG